MTSRWEDLFLLAANQYVRDRQELSRLAEELEERRDLRPSINIRRIDSLSVINDVRELRQENTALLDLLHKLQMELEHSAQSLGQREDELRAAAQEASKMKGHIHRLTGELDKRDLELQRASRSLAAIETSTSWRLTAPMRRLVSTIKGRSAR